MDTAQWVFIFALHNDARKDNLGIKLTCHQPFSSLFFQSASRISNVDKKFQKRNNFFLLLWFQIKLESVKKDIC